MKSVFPWFEPMVQESQKGIDWNAETFIYNIREKDYQISWSRGHTKRYISLLPAVTLCTPYRYCISVYTYRYCVFCIMIDCNVRRTRWRVWPTLYYSIVRYSLVVTRPLTKRVVRYFSKKPRNRTSSRISWQQQPHLFPKYETLKSERNLHLPLIPGIFYHHG